VPQRDPSLAPWESLPDALRKSNLDQANDIERKLAAIGCGVVLLHEDNHVVFEFADSEVELLAELEHDRWLQERRGAGWTLAPVKDVRLRRSPFMVPWDQLTEPAREIDREVVRALPKLLADAGFAIRRNID
jgi:RyR domain